MARPSDIHLLSIVSRFQLAEADLDCQAFGTGHIHDTFVVRSQAEPRYLLQRINHAVYQDVAGLMQNIRRVTDHLQQKLSGANTSLTSFRVVLTHDQQGFYQDEAGCYWRMFTFVDNTVAYEVAQSAAPIQEAGRAFGRFIALLRDLPGEPLVTTIPAFHHMDYRLDNFERAVTEDTVGRLAQVSEAVDFVRQRADEMEALHQQVAHGTIPLRTTHNDTKLSNILFDERTHEARCVVDLDTVMPGTVLYDFGDAIRSMASPAAEDEADLDRVQFHFPFYEAFVRGFLPEVRSFLTDTEVDQLPLSARYMTFIMGLRFLTDYLAGDVYYKIHDAEQNLRRARNQFQLVRRMEEQYDEMVRVVRWL